MKIAALALSTAMMMAPWVGTAYADDEPQWNCKDPQAQQEMNYCSEVDFEAADKQLNAVYKKAMASQVELDKQSAEIDPSYVGAVKALKKAQRAWIDYRDGHCDGMGYQAVGGSMQPMLISGCKTGLTNNRIKELKELTEGLGN